METAGGIEKLVLAYSGGLDTSVMLHWLKQQYGCRVLAFIADVGQGEDLGAAREKALRTGADRVVISDLRQEFVEQFVFPAVQAHAVYEGEYLLGTSLARPAIARQQVRVAREWRAEAVAHGATGKGNDQVRFELAFQALAPDLMIVAPWRHWSFKGRSDLIAYAREYGIEVTSTVEKPYSIDRNLMHSSYEGGILEDPWLEPPPGLFQLTTDPEAAPDCPETLILSFEAGIPVALNGAPMAPVELLRKLNQLAGRHGVGRVDLVENRLVGMKSRGVYETPGVTVLHRAHRGLESITLDREVAHFKQSLENRLAELVYYGFWFSPEMEVLLKTLETTQRNVSGDVKVKLYKGVASILGRRSVYSLYDPELATFEQDSVYSQADAEGFIRLQGLRLRVAAKTASNSPLAVAERG